MPSAEGRRHFAQAHRQHTAIVVDAGKQPTQAKATGEVGQARALFHQYETAIPNLLELGTRHADCSGGVGLRATTAFASVWTRKRQRPSRRSAMQGSGAFAKPPPICAIGSRPKPKCLGAAHHFGDVDAIAAAATNLRLVRVDAMEPQQPHQRRKPVLGRGRFVSRYEHPASPTRPHTRSRAVACAPTAR